MRTKKPLNIPASDRLRYLAEGFLASNHFYTSLEAITDPDRADDLSEVNNVCVLRCWNGIFYLWVKGVYYEIPEGDMRSYIGRYLHNYNRAVDDDKDKVCVTQTVVNNVLLNLRSLIEVHIPSFVQINSMLPRMDELPLFDGDSDRQKGHTWISFNNKLVCVIPAHDLVKSYDPSPLYFTLSRLPYDYDPKAKCDLWEQKVYEIMSDDMQRVQLLAEWFGYCLMPSQKFHKFMILAGEGSNGKGVISGVLERLVGLDNVAHVPLVQFADKFALSFLMGKMLNTSSESSRRIGSDAEAYLKAYTAGDRMMFERKYKDPISSYPTAKVMLSTNELPSLSDRSDGIWRRLLFIPFDRQFFGVEKDPDLLDKLSEELPGIFNWAVEGMQSLIKNKGFIEPDRCIEAIDDYKRDTNPARTFLEDNYHYEAGYEEGIKSNDIYQAYRIWCDKSNYKPLSEGNFGKEIKRVFPGTEKIRKREGINRIYVYSGIIEEI